MSPAVWTTSSTVSSHTPVQSSADHGYHHRLDGAIEGTGAGQSSSVNSTTETQTVPMSPDAMSSPEAGRSFTDFSHNSDRSATGQSYHRVENALHCTDTCDTSIIGETGVGKSSLVNSTANTQTASMSPGTMSSSSDARKISSTESLHASVHSAASHRSERVRDASHRADTCYTTPVKETGACQRSRVDLTTGMQMEPSSRSAMPPPGRALSTSNISDKSVAFPTFDPVGGALCRMDSSMAAGPVIVRETGAYKNYWPTWLIRVHTPGRGAAYPNYRRIEEALHRTDTCNVVIIGETGSGKSSLVNLITGKEKAPTSLDATGCTTEPTVYEHDVMTQDKTMKVQLFDTAGLDEGPQGTVPTMQARTALKTLLRTLKKSRGIHLLIYCVQGTQDARALQRNYKLLQSKVKGRVPIVLVVTALEDREPDMEDWWRNNEKSISDLGMNFAGHACITAVTIDQDDTDKLRRRHEQSYHAVCNLIEQRFQQNGTPRVITIPPVRKTKNIVLFGEAGAGKSSIVNLMAGRDIACTSPGVRRCTLQWQDYIFDFDGQSYKVFDTIGIEESGLEMEEYLVAVANAYRFIKTLDAEGGVDLLLFCVRAGRFTAALQSNYRFFYEFLCDKKVPIVLAITNLEREQRMEDWWDREQRIFPQYGIHVAGHACITAANGLDGRHQQLYEESRTVIRTLVKGHITGDHNDVWTGGSNVFVSLVRALKKLLVKNTHIRKMNLTGQLTKRCGMPRETAGLLADMIEQGEVRVDSA